MAILKEPLILDIEASGFGAQSYPIEVGLAMQNDKRYCRLIKPQKNWRFWSDEAQSVHGITRELLEKKGEHAVKVAGELNKLLAGRTVYSDAWVVDEPWVIKLFEAANVERLFTLSDITTIFDEQVFEVWDFAKELVIEESAMTRHRASNDAYIIQQTYARAQTIVSMPR